MADENPVMLEQMRPQASFDRGHLPTARVWHKRWQREVTITAADFDPAQHELIEPVERSKMLVFYARLCGPNRTC